MYIKNNSGGTIVIVILVMAMLGILGSAFVVATTGEGIQAINHEHQTQAHYNARSGAYMGMEWLKSEVNKEDGSSWLDDGLYGSDNSKVFYVTEGDEIKETDPGEYKIKIELSKYKNSGINVNEGHIDLISIGKHEGKDDAVSIRDMIFKPSVITDLDNKVDENKTPDVDMAIFSSGLMIVKNNIKIEGDVGTNLSSINKKNKANITGQIRTDLKRNYPKANFPDKESLEKKQDIIGKGDSFINGDGYYNKVSTGGQVKVELNGDRTIRVNEINLDGNGSIDIVGNGRVFLFLDNKIKLTGAGQSGGIKVSENAELFIFYNGADSLQFLGNSPISGLIYAPFADVKFGGSSNTKGVSIVANTAELGGSFKTFRKVLSSDFPGSIFSNGDEIKEEVSKSPEIFIGSGIWDND